MGSNSVLYTNEAVEEKKIWAKPVFEPGAARWVARMLPLCYEETPNPPPSDWLLCQILVDPEFWSDRKSSWSNSNSSKQYFGANSRRSLFVPVTVRPIREVACRAIWSLFNPSSSLGYKIKTENPQNWLIAVSVQAKLNLNCAAWNCH